MVSRLEFLKTSVRLLTGSVVNAVGSKLPEEINNAHSTLRPPGAVEDFLNVCTECSECVPVCPANAIFMKLDQLTGKELPTIDPSIAACTMCEELSCTKACPDTALVMPSDSKFPKIGLAVFDTAICLAYNNSPCYTCYDACPLKRTAMIMKLNRPIIIESECTGCGLCQQSCILDNPKGIVVFLS